MTVTMKMFSKMKSRINIARGTTDPEIDSVTWIKFSNNMDILVTRWSYLH